MNQTEEILAGISAEAARANAAQRASAEQTRLRNAWRQAATQAANRHRDARDSLIVEAAEVGVPRRLLAQAAHVSRQRVDQILGREEAW